MDLTVPSQTPEIDCVPELIIEPRTGWINLELGELWNYRELLYFLTWREIKVRYKQTALGATWAILQPLLTTIVFSLFFGRLAKMPSEGVPYPVFTLAALVPWMFFSNGLSQVSNSLVGSANLLTKVYFPRLIIPLSAVLSGAVDFCVASTLLLCTMIFFGIWPGWNVMLILPFLLLVATTSLGVGLWLSALNVEYRDVRHTVPFLTQFWMFATPIVYPSSLLPEPWRTLYGINPMAGVVDGFRWAFLGIPMPSPYMLLISSLMSVLLLIGGTFYFKRMEGTFAERV